MKTIAVPKIADVKELLDINQCPADQLEELVLPQEQFDKLLSTGLFKEINRICGLMIDDYEDESVSEMVAVQAVIELIQSKQWDDDVNDSMKKIESLFVKAKEYNTSVHFYF